MVSQQTSWKLSRSHEFAPNSDYKETPGVLGHVSCSNGIQILIHKLLMIVFTRGSSDDSDRKYGSILRIKNHQRIRLPASNVSHIGTDAKEQAGQCMTVTSKQKKCQTFWFLTRRIPIIVQEKGILSLHYDMPRWCCWRRLPLLSSDAIWKTWFLKMLMRKLQFQMQN